MSCTDRDFTCAVRPGTETAVTAQSVTQAACSGVVVVMGPQTLTQSPAGCVSVERTSFAVADGVYTNATITMQNGHVAAVSQGAPLLQAVTPLCTAASTTGGTAGNAMVAVNNDACNLSSFSGGELTTLVFAEGTRGVNVSGCGTAADPIVVQGPVLPTVPTITGVTATTCGIQIASGLVKAWTPPLMGVTTLADSGLTLTPSTSGCTVAIELSAATKATLAAAAATTTTTTTTSGGTTTVVTTRYAEPVGVAFSPDTSSSTSTTGTLNVFGLPNTTYLIEWKSANMAAAGLHYGNGTVFTVTTDGTGTYSGGFGSVRAGLYSVTRTIDGINTVVYYTNV